MPEPIRALIYLSPGQLTLEQAGARCLAYCEQLGYKVVGLVVDDAAASRWRDGVIGLLAAGGADVVVVHDQHDLHPDRTPRLEAVADQAPIRPPANVGPGFRRRVRPRPVQRCGPAGTPPPHATTAPPPTRIPPSTPETPAPPAS